MRSLYQSLSQIKENQNYVVAIVIETEGSTYRKTGAMMLIDQHQNYWGLLSGGCLENDIVEHCKQVFSTQQDKCIHYNMRDEADMLWGMGLGCDGEITILLKLLPRSLRHFDFFKNLRKIDSGCDCVMSIDSNDSYRMAFTFDDKANEISPSSLTFTIRSPHQLLICGGSPDVPPVSAIAHQVGWKTTIIDHRANYADNAKFPQADSVLHVKRNEWSSFSLESFDSAIIMSHQFERDVEYLSRLLASSVSYIGLLGPSKRRDKLLEACNTQFSEQEGRVFGPIGLDIGASSPETIALAIISEIQAIKNCKNKDYKIAFCYQDETR